MAVDLSAMRKLYQDGALENAVVAPAPTETGAWVFSVIHTDGTIDTMTIARSTRQKIYKSLDAVAADAERVGFKEVKLEVSLNVA